MSEQQCIKELLLSTFNYTCVGCGKRFWWGPLTSEIKAALAYNKFVQKVHGEFAYLNIIE